MSPKLWSLAQHRQGWSPKKIFSALTHRWNFKSYYLKSKASLRRVFRKSHKILIRPLITLCSLQLSAALVTSQEINRGWISGNLNLDVNLGLFKMFFFFFFWEDAQLLKYFSTFLFSTSSRPTLGPTQPPIQWLPGALSPGVKWQGREGDHSPPAIAEVKKIWIYASIPPYAFMA
jgi:hypothetical protein